MKKKFLIKYGIVKNGMRCTTSLDNWLKKKNMTFDEIDSISIGDRFMVATVEFDKDHCIYVLLPKEVFSEEV